MGKARWQWVAKDRVYECTPSSFAYPSTFYRLSTFLYRTHLVPQKGITDYKEGNLLFRLLWHFKAWMNGTNLCKRKSIPWCSSDFNESYLCLYSFPCSLFILNIPHLAKRHEQFAKEPRVHLGERVPQNTLADLCQRSNTNQLSVIVAKDVRSKDCTNTWHLNRKSVRREVWLAVLTASRPPFFSFVRQPLIAILQSCHLAAADMFCKGIWWLGQTASRPWACGLFSWKSSSTYGGAYFELPICFIVPPPFVGRKYPLDKLKRLSEIREIKNLKLWQK